MDNQKCTQLVELINHGSIDAIEAFYDENNQAFAVPIHRDRLFALHCAVIAGRLDVVQLILTKVPMAIEAKDLFEQTPLLWAAAQGHKDIIVFLMNQGANCTIFGKTNEDAVHGHRSVVGWSRHRNHLECVETIHEIQYQQTINLLASLAAPLTDFHSVTVCIGNFIKTENIKGLNYILENTLYLRRLPVKNRLSLLRLAHKYLESEVLIKFLAQCHKWPEQVNEDGLSLLEWTVSEGLERFLTIFSAMDMKYLPFINDYFGNSAPRNLLDLAKKNDQFDMLNTLIIHSFHAYQHHLSEPSSSEPICWALFPHLSDYILSGEQLIELAALEKDLLPFLLQISNYRAVLEADPKISLEGSVYRTYLTQRKSHRKSMECVLDPVSQTIEIFHPKRLLGNGTYGCVREMMNDNGQSRAVKSFQYMNSRLLSTELSFLKRVYPTHSFFGFVDYQSQQSRLTMPCFKGEFFERICQRLSCEKKLAQLIHAIALAILKIHQIGVIHGDITNANLLVNEEEGQWIVQPIDFGISYSIDKGSVDGFDLDKKDARYPPEFFGSGIKITPHPRQDVYMLGSLLRSGIRKSSIETTISEKFPLITTFIELALLCDPEKRPNLETFCNNLASELEEQTIASQAEPSSSVSMR